MDMRSQCNLTSCEGVKKFWLVKKLLRMRRQFFLRDRLCSFMLRTLNPHGTYVSSCPQCRLSQYLRSQVQFQHALRSCRESHQRCTSMPPCFPTRVLVTAGCELGQQECSNAIGTHRHCMSIALVENTQRHVDNCR